MTSQRTLFCLVWWGAVFLAHFFAPISRTPCCGVCGEGLLSESDSTAALCQTINLSASLHCFLAADNWPHNDYNPNLTTRDGKKQTIVI